MTWAREACRTWFTSAPHKRTKAASLQEPGVKIIFSCCSFQHTNQSWHDSHVELKIRLKLSKGIQPFMAGTATNNTGGLRATQRVWIQRNLTSTFYLNEILQLQLMIHSIKRQSSENVHYLLRQSIEKACYTPHRHVSGLQIIAKIVLYISITGESQRWCGRWLQILSKAATCTFKVPTPVLATLV